MRKLMIIGGALVAGVAVGAILWPITDRARIENTDFVNFYAAASIVRSGSGASLYQPRTQDGALRAILGRSSTQYFLHPPFEAAALAPLSLLNVEHGFVLWTAINVAALAVLPLILMPCIPLVARKPYLGLLGFCFLPALTTIASWLGWIVSNASGVMRSWQRDGILLSIGCDVVTIRLAGSRQIRLRF